MPHTEPHRKYTKQIIFDFVDNKPLGSQGIAELISEKSQHRNRITYPDGINIVPVIVLSKNLIRVSPEFIAACGSINATTRIYINSHCRKGSDSICTDDHVEISADYLASVLDSYILPTSNVRQRTDGSKLKISLTGCHAGTPSTSASGMSASINNSFGALFSYYLNAHNINCVVAARCGL